jgi:hypothetical protein
VRFEWDSKKAAASLKNHRVSFDEAVSVFADPLASIFDDEAHSNAEPARSSSDTRFLTGSSWFVLLSRSVTWFGSSRRGWHQAESVKIMKKTRTGNRTKPASEEMRKEYRFDYGKARPNRFAKQMADASPLVVVVDSDVAEVFGTAESINNALRALISAVPGARGKPAQG